MSDRPVAHNPTPPSTVLDNKGAKIHLHLHNHFATTTQQPMPSEMTSWALWRRLQHFAAAL